MRKELNPRHGGGPEPPLPWSPGSNNDSELPERDASQEPGLHETHLLPLPGVHPLK